MTVIIALEHEWQTWHATRERDLDTPHGWLTVVAFNWLSPSAEELPGLPGTWSVSDGAAVVTATASDGLTLDGEPVDGTITATVAEAGSLAWLRYGDKLVELVLRGGRYAIRQRDPEAATRRSFDGVPAFPVDPLWIVAGRYIPYDEPRQVEVATARADLRQYVTAVGVVHVELGGTAYGLVATVAAGGRIDGPVGLSFHDETNGSETAPWRTVTTGQPGKDGEVVVDFNRTINLPFAFTDYGTCPAPVEGNRLALALTAGEKNPR
ncbi:MAG: uncharacterized protein QOH50_720 [Kribbellaceae bacterium]|jgi:uncharacterized protein (DUF1684 family)|nr:uncharacterized protein [Kribbellaceae bacterium]